LALRKSFFAPLSAFALTLLQLSASQIETKGLALIGWSALRGGAIAAIYCAQASAMTFAIQPVDTSYIIVGKAR
jgi:hypothetical protein